MHAVEEKGFLVKTAPETPPPASSVNIRPANQSSDGFSQQRVAVYFPASGEGGGAGGRGRGVELTGNDVCKWKPQLKMNEILKT